MRLAGCRFDCSSVASIVQQRSAGCLLLTRPRIQPTYNVPWLFWVGFDTCQEVGKKVVVEM